MSTKCTLAYSPSRGESAPEFDPNNVDDFHFYEDLVDTKGHYYLELRGKNIDFHSAPDHVVVRIPHSIWESIRKVGIPLGYAPMNDEAIRKTAEEAVDKRIAEYAAETNEQVKTFLGFSGLMVFGGADESREAQIASGIEYFTKERERQLQILERMKTHKVYTIDESESDE